MSQDKNPIAVVFTEFFDSVKVEMESRRLKRESDAIKRTMASSERLGELADLATRGDSTKKFVQSDFWLKYLLPFLRSEAVLKPAVLKEAEAAPHDRSWMAYLIGSGKVLILTKMLSALDDWQAQGEEAAKVLALEVEKRRRVGA